VAFFLIDLMRRVQARNIRSRKEAGRRSAEFHHVIEDGKNLV
jgi:hypothetical protein